MKGFRKKVEEDYDDVAEEEGGVDKTVFYPVSFWQKLWLFVSRLLGSRLS